MEEDKTQGKAIGKKGTVLAIIIILIVVAVMALTIRSCTIIKKSTGEQSTYTNKLREDKSVDSEKKQVENQENSSKVEKQEQPTEKEIKKSNNNNAENKVNSSSNSVNIVGVESEPAMSKVYNTSVVILEKRVYVIDKTSYAHAFIMNMLKKDGSDTKITYFCSPEEYGKYLVGDKVGITFKVDSNSTVSVQSIDTVK